MILFAILALPLLFVTQAPAANPAANKVEIVSVTGCLREQGAGNWMLVAATDPVPSIANQAPAAELPKVPPAGKNTFRLLGVGEFNLPHAVVVDAKPEASLPC